MNRTPVSAAWCRSTFTAVVLAGTWAISTPVTVAQTPEADGDPLPPVPPATAGPTAQAADPLLQEILDEAEAIRETESDTADNQPHNTNENLEEDENLADGQLVAPPAIVPDDPQDITTPEAPPLLELPDDVPAIESPNAAETLELPQDPLQVRVESIQTLTLEDAFQLSLENNPTIRQAELDVEIARKQVSQARGEYFPQLSTSVNYAFTDPATPDPVGTPSFDPFTGETISGIDSNIQNSLNGQFRLDFTIIDGGGRTARNLIADQAVAIAEFNLDQTIQGVQLEVATAYYSLQLADTNVLVAEAQVNDSQTSLQDAEARERAGIGTRFEVLQAQTELANDEVALIDALNNQRVARFDLARILSFDTTVEVAAVDPIDPTETWDLSLEETIVRAFETRAEFESLREQVEQLRQQAQNSLSNVRPNVSIFSTFDYQADFDGDNSGNPFLERGYSVGAAFNWSFFDGFQSLSAAQQADLEREQTRIGFEEARDSIRFEVEQAYFSLNSFREQIDAAKVGLESAQEELRLARLRFEAGVGTQTDVLNAQTRLAEARQNLSNSVSNYNLSVVQLRRAVNGL
ncbi:MAG: TolC family protein [Synechococcus sp.]